MDPVSISTAAGIAGPLVSGAGSFFAGGARAEQKEVASRAGKVKAAQVGNAYLAELNNTLGNINAIRASVGAKGGPTERAILKNQTKISDRNRRIKEAGLQLQAGQDQADADLLQFSALTALGLGGLRSAKFGFE